MTQATQSEAYRIVWLVRRLFRAMSQKASENLEGLGITVADRAVMEFLYPDKALSVPEIAERYQVSRQHVQNTVNSLLDSDLVTTHTNPRHKRSPLIALNAAGREMFSRILDKDEAVLKTVFANTPSHDLHITRQTLQALLDKLR